MGYCEFFSMRILGMDRGLEYGREWIGWGLGGWNDRIWYGLGLIWYFLMRKLCCFVDNDGNFFLYSDLMINLR